MLACLIAVPLAALFGTALPEMARRLFGERLGLVEIASQPLAEGAAFSSTAQAAPSPMIENSLTGEWGASGLPFGPASSNEKTPALPAQPAGTVGPPAATLRLPEQFTHSGVVKSPASGIHDAIPASYQSPVSSAGDLEFLRWPEEPSKATSLVPVEAFPAPIAARNSGASLPPPADSQACVDQFSHIQRRFRELGATYTLLETWGDQGQLYRFYCRMAMGGSSSYTRFFEATDADPLGAMSRVLAQVEAWRSAGQP
jgi:hypothetical protein